MNIILFLTSIPQHSLSSYMMHRQCCVCLQYVNHCLPLLCMLCSPFFPICLNHISHALQVKLIFPVKLWCFSWLFKWFAMMPLFCKAILSFFLKHLQCKQLKGLVRRLPATALKQKINKQTCKTSSFHDVKAKRLKKPCKTSSSIGVKANN